MPDITVLDVMAGAACGVFGTIFGLVVRPARNTVPFAFTIGALAGVLASAYNHG